MQKAGLTGSRSQLSFLPEIELVTDESRSGILKNKVPPTAVGGGFELK